MDGFVESLKSVGVSEAVYLAFLLFAMLIIYSINLTGKRVLNFLIGTLMVIGVLLVFEKIQPQTAFLNMLVTSIGALYGIVTWSRRGTDASGKSKPGDKRFALQANGKRVLFDNPYRNFLVIAGSGSGKTKSIGKPLLENYIKHGFAGFVYDLKDFDYTKTAYALTLRYNYPHKFYYINFMDLSRSYRTNVIKPKLIEENLLLQLMADVMKSYLKDGQENEWFINALGVLKGVAVRFYHDFPEHCNLPNVVNYCVHNSPKRLTEFLKARPECVAIASGFISSADSPKTQASILSTLTGYIGDLAFNKKVCYVLSGDDFDFNIIDPMNPKLIAISNSYQMQEVVGPVIGLMIKTASRHFTLANKVPAVFFLDEATTFKIDGFENMPSILREYKCSFTMLTQSTAKIERLYGKLDKASLQANFGNVFYGSISETTDIQNFSILFSKRKDKRVSRTIGNSGHRDSRSTSVTIEEKNRYDPYFFQQLKPGEFVGVTREANLAEFHLRFKQFEEQQEVDLPIVHNITEFMLNQHYEKIVSLVKSI